MVNIQSKAEANTVSPKATQEMESTVPASPMASNDSSMDEATLRGLPRAELQKLAKAHKIKANLKSAMIIPQLSTFEEPERKRPATDDLEGSSKKRLKSAVAPKDVQSSAAPKLNRHSRAPRAPARRQRRTLSPGAKRKKEAILAKQEAEIRELEALARGEGPSNQSTSTTAASSVQ